MFDIGWTEILIIAVVAILVVGPKDLPRMLRALGRYAGQLRRTANDFRAQFDEALKESELDELRTSMNEMRDLNPVNQIRDTVSESLDPLTSTAADIKSSIEGQGQGQPAAEAEADKPSSETTPEPAKQAPRKTAAKPDAAEAGG